jgi:hypothetical protein
VRTGVLGESPDRLADLREEIRHSERVRRLLAPSLSAGSPGIYAKWQGAHWVLSALADLGYPPGDSALIPLRERVLVAWLDESFYAEFEIRTKAGPIGSAVCRRGWPVPPMRLTAGQRAALPDRSRARRRAM